MFGSGVKQLQRLAGGWRLTALALTVASVSVFAPQPVVAADLNGSFKDDPIDPVVERRSIFYGALRGGAAWGEDTGFDIAGPTGIGNSYEEPGWFIGGALGLDLRSLMGIQGLRAEIELLYMENEIDSHNVGGVVVGGADAFGTTSATVGFASLYYDFFPNARFSPFVGVGLGAANVDFDGHGVTGPGVVMSNDDTAFAWHITAGLSFDMTSNLKLEAGYRYIAINDVGLTAVDGTTSSTDVDNHVVYLGARISF